MADTKTSNGVTILDTPAHLRAGDSVAQPVAILFHDDYLDRIAELRMTPAQARELAAALLDHAKRAEG